MRQERIAVTVWADRVSPVLDVSTRAILFSVEDGQPTGRTEVELPGSPGAKLNVLAERGVTTLLCGAVSRVVSQQAASFGLELIPFLAGEVDEVLAAFLAGRLPHPDFIMPGCQGRGRRGRGSFCRRGRYGAGKEKGYATR